MRFRLRDVFWLIFIVSLACLLWRERNRTNRLAMEASYFHSMAPPIELIDVPLENAIDTLAAQHKVTIEVDWPSVTEATKMDQKFAVTHNLADGSLVRAIDRLFFGHAIAETTADGILIRGRDPARDGPPPLDWIDRFRKEFTREVQP